MLRAAEIGTQQRLPALDERQVSLIGLPEASPDRGMSGQYYRALSRSSIDRRFALERMQQGDELALAVRPGLAEDRLQVGANRMDGITPPLGNLTKRRT